MENRIPRNDDRPVKRTMIEFRLTGKMDKTRLRPRNKKFENNEEDKIPSTNNSAEDWIQSIGEKASKKQRPSHQAYAEFLHHWQYRQENLFSEQKNNIGIKDGLN